MDDSPIVYRNDGGIISHPSDEKFPYEGGVGTVLFEKMRESKDKIALIDAVTEEHITYETWLQRCIRTAITMRSKGITPDDIITVCSSSHLNTCVPLIASLFIGVKYANTDPRFSLSDTVLLLKQIKPKMAFASPEGVKLTEDALAEIGHEAEIVVFGETTKHTPFSEFLLASPEEEHFRPVFIKNMKETAAIFFSSGSTGLAKGICLNHLSLLGQMLAMRNRPSFIESSLNFSSPHWISLTIAIVMTIFSQARMLIAPAFDVTTLWTYLDKYKINVLMLSPTHVATICQYGRPDGIDTSSLLLCAGGGSPVPLEHVQEMRKLLPGSLFSIGYGQTEIGGGMAGSVSMEDIMLAQTKPMSCGRLIPGMHVKVVDPETEMILGANEQGEIRIKTEFVMNGYHNVDCSHVWDSDGFLKTGDIGYYDEDYNFFIVDRIKEMLKYQNWQIAPARLEGILMEHPAVEWAVVVGLPHPVDGDHPIAVVMLGKEHVGKVTAEEIQKYVDDRVSNHQRLRGGVKIVSSMPITTTGKFKRKELRDMVLKGKLL